MKGVRGITKQILRGVFSCKHFEAVKICWKKFVEIAEEIIKQW
jgi:hypothetical protein